MKRYRATVEFEVLPDVTASEVRRVLMNAPWVTKVTIEAESPPPGALVGFIYDASSAETPCHAVLFKKEGPWSKYHFGFCGAEPGIGPKALLDTPQGGLCRACAKYIKQTGAVWCVIAEPPLPEPPRPYVTRGEGLYDDD